MVSREHKSQNVHNRERNCPTNLRQVVYTEYLRFGKIQIRSKHGGGNTKQKPNFFVKIYIGFNDGELILTSHFIMLKKWIKKGPWKKGQEDEQVIDLDEEDEDSATPSFSKWVHNSICLLLFIIGQNNFLLGFNKKNLFVEGMRSQKRYY